MKRIYIKNDQKIIVNNNFIYCISVYKIWKNGASLIEEKYYSSSKPIKFNKKNLMLKKREYSLVRFIDLEYAPESFLIKNNFKLNE